jgi:Rrf2 family protein
MRISRKSEYALRALVAIARRGRSVQIQELSESENIPVKFLEQILLALRNAGLLASRRGVGGGYTLATTADRITAGEVIRIMDGPLAPVPCAASKQTERCTCPDPRTCSIRLLMTEVRQQLSDKLDHCTIEEMLRMSRSRDALAFDI